MNSRTPNRFLTRSGGMSLIELLVSLSLGAIMIIGAVTVYVQSQANYLVNEAMARIQENARFAFNTMEPDVRLTSMWGLNNVPAGFITGATTAVLPTPAGLGVAGDCRLNWAIDLSLPVEGNNNAYPYGAGCPAFGAGPSPTSDVLVVRHASTTPTLPTVGLMQIQTEFARGQVFSNGVVPAGFLPANSITSTLMISGYYISQDSTIGVGIPSLRRKTLQIGPTVIDQEVIPGVQDLQIQMGVDTTGDGAVNQYVNPGGEPVGSTTMAVRVWMLMRAERQETGFVDGTNYIYADQNLGPFNDAFRRLLVSKTILLRNQR